MNERIKELWETNDTIPVIYPVPGRSVYVTEQILEQFAELIVRECIRVPYAMWDKAELNADVAVKIDHRIKDHFGVE
mgnify:CR=1 FL=1